MSEESMEVTLLLYDYNIVGKNMGTHSSIKAFRHEYWFSIEGIKKRNCRTKTKFQLDETNGQWVQLNSDDSISSLNLFKTLSSTMRNLGSVSSNSSTPRDRYNCGITEVSERSFEQQLKYFILEEFNTKTYAVASHNCNNFTRHVLKYLKPTERELGLDVLTAILMETAETVNGIEYKIEETKANAVEFVENNLPLVIAGAAAATSFLLSKLIR